MKDTITMHWYNYADANHLNIEKIGSADVNVMQDFKHYLAKQNIDAPDDLSALKLHIVRWLEV